ncbi:MAG: hypothetical protein WAT17_01715 [Candidatus Saccharimonadales bacterium]|jgi:hypothetical protein
MSEVSIDIDRAVHSGAMNGGCDPNLGCDQGGDPELCLGARMKVTGETVRGAANEMLAAGQASPRRVLGCIARRSTERPPCMTGIEFDKIEELLTIGEPLFLSSRTDGEYSVITGIVTGWHAIVESTDSDDDLGPTIRLSHRVYLSTDDGERSVDITRDNVDRTLVGVEALLGHVLSEIRASSIHWVSVPGLVALGECIRACGQCDELSEGDGAEVDLCYGLLQQQLRSRLAAGQSRRLFAELADLDSERRHIATALERVFPDEYDIISSLIGDDLALAGLTDTQRAALRASFPHAPQSLFA